jgi:nitrogen regulatory protein PII
LNGEATVKLILAIIRPEKLAAVQTALSALDVQLMTVSEVFDCGSDRGSLEIYRGRQVRRPVAKLRLEIAVPGLAVDAAVAAITRAGCGAEPGKANDGEVLVLGLDECVRIRAGAPATLAL